MLLFCPFSAPLQVPSSLLQVVMEKNKQYTSERLVFLFCYLPPSQVADKKIATILSTVCSSKKKTTN